MGKKLCLVTDRLDAIAKDAHLSLSRYHGGVRRKRHVAYFVLKRPAKFCLHKPKASNLELEYQRQKLSVYLHFLSKGRRCLFGNMASPSGSSVTLEALGSKSETTLAAARETTSSSADHDRKSEKSDDKKPRTKRRKRSNSNESTAGMDQDGTSRKESLSGALARSLVGTLAFVFRAPVRLFRPVKLSSWSLLETMAKREGRSLSLRYLRTLLRREKRSFLPHLLLPPLLVNTTIGFCLFEAYSLTESRLLGEYYPLTEVEEQGTSTKKSTAPAFTPLWIVAIAGGAAGAAQCIVSAPLDNVRIILSSDIGKVGGRHHRGSSNGRSRLAAHPLGISWRAVARAAILPFAPAVTRDRLVEEVRKSSAAAGKTSTSPIWRSLLGLAGRNVSAQEAEQTRQIWEKRLERWRGGVHGAGLIMSLARDSVGEFAHCNSCYFNALPKKADILEYSP